MSTSDRIKFLECVNSGLKTILEEPTNPGAIINVVKKHIVIWSMIEDGLRENSIDSQSNKVGDLTLELAGNLMTSLMGACINEGTPAEEMFEFIASVKSMSKAEKMKFLEQI
jgi:hypothetical protein